MANIKVTSLEQNILKTQRHLDLVGSYFSKKKNIVERGLSDQGKLQWYVKVTI